MALKSRTRQRIPAYGKLPVKLSQIKGALCYNFSKVKDFVSKINLQIFILSRYLWWLVFLIDWLYITSEIMPRATEVLVVLIIIIKLNNATKKLHCCYSYLVYISLPLTFR